MASLQISSSPFWVDKCLCAYLRVRLWCLHTDMRAHALWLTATEINLTIVTRSLNTFEDDSPCQSALCVECFLDACFQPEGAWVSVYVCVWVSPPCFLPGKTLLSLLVFPVMSHLPEAQHGCQRQSEMASWTARRSATEIQKLPSYSQLLIDNLFIFTFSVTQSSRHVHIFIFKYSTHAKVPHKTHTHTSGSTNVVCLEGSRYLLFITNVDGGESSSDIIVSHYCQMQKDLKGPKCFIKGCGTWGK